MTQEVMTTGGTGLVTYVLSPDIGIGLLHEGSWSSQGITCDSSDLFQYSTVCTCAVAKF